MIFDVYVFLILDDISHQPQPLVRQNELIGKHGFMDQYQEARPQGVVNLIITIHNLFGDFILGH